MAAPPKDPVKEVGSFVESLRLDALWSENPLRAWLALLVSILVAVVVARLTAWALARIARRFETRGWTGHPEAALALAGPASLAIVTFGLSVGLAGLRMEHDVLRPFVERILLLLNTIAVFWYAYNLVDMVDVLVRQMAHGADAALQRQIILLLSRSLRVFLVAVGTMVIAESVFDQPIGAWLTGLGIVGLAVSLAAQDSLKNLFGSLTILLDHSIRLGDQIISCGYNGTVEDIGFRSTKVRTAAGHLVTIPNANLMNNTIENVSRRKALCRIVTLVVSPRTPADKLRQSIQALSRIFDEEDIRGSVRPFIDGIQYPPQVRLDEIQATGLKLTVTYWYAPATDPDYTAHAERVNLRIVEELQKVGVEWAELGRQA